ncbi:ATP-grasp fold amidoligase family protein [Aeromicrobium sp. UC242_57]|uniref:ATP-grasp fold amidoligase family protein n=1 Tax=Aeromicrobium sp. UC242_57 TaxID=3374624 RepID=UPI0037BD66F2
MADRVEKIRFGKLPERFYLKTNHGCGYNIACPDKSAFDVADARRRMRRYLSADYSAVAGERQYRRIARKVFAEEFLDMSRPRCMMLRLFCFDGDVSFIQVDTASGRVNPVEGSFHLPDWTLAPFRYGRHYPDVVAERPHNLDEVLSMASALSKGLPFVRVDLYWLDGRIVFSELTLTPSRGTRRLIPAQHDRAIGRLFDLPHERRSMWVRRALRPVKGKATVRLRRDGRRAVEEVMKAEPFWWGVHGVLGLQRPYRQRQVPLAAIPAHVTHVIVPGQESVSRASRCVLRERLDRAVEVARARPTCWSSCRATAARLRVERTGR